VSKVVAAVEMARGAEAMVRVGRRAATVGVGGLVVLRVLEQLVRLEPQCAKAGFKVDPAKADLEMVDPERVANAMAGVSIVRVDQDQIPEGRVLRVVVRKEGQREHAGLAGQAGLVRVGLVAGRV
jgi:hypothetical protein